MCNMNWDRITAQDLFGELLNGLAQYSVWPSCKYIVLHAYYYVYFLTCKIIIPSMRVLFWRDMVVVDPSC